MKRLAVNLRHPGEILKKEYCEPLGISQTELAEKHLGVSRKHINSILNGHDPIYLDLAIRLSRAFKTSPEFWLNLQMEYDIARYNGDAFKVKPVF
ncbi:MAG TPA: HigA family addiction module antitoxin [Chitinophagaceae bacterium]|jgi:addiction module HigA family antidote|nr:HigA family addiction module antitoxin [Chitinophagaceae bacterium]